MGYRFDDLTAACQHDWRRYLEHDFVRELGAGSLAHGAWIAMYEGEDFQGAMRAELEWLNARLADVTPARFQELSEVFRDATRLEIDFWQMGLDRAD